MPGPVRVRYSRGARLRAGRSLPAGLLNAFRCRQIGLDDRRLRSRMPERLHGAMTMTRWAIGNGHQVEPLARANARKREPNPGRGTRHDYKWGTHPTPSCLVPATCERQDVKRNPKTRLSISGTRGSELRGGQSRRSGRRHEAQSAVKPVACLGFKGNIYPPEGFPLPLMGFPLPTLNAPPMPGTRSNEPRRFGAAITCAKKQNSRQLR